MVQKCVYTRINSGTAIKAILQMEYLRHCRESASALKHTEAKTMAENQKLFALGKVLEHLLKCTHACCIVVHSHTNGHTPIP